MGGHKKSRNPNCSAGKWCGVDEARTRDLLRDSRAKPLETKRIR